MGSDVRPANSTRGGKQAQSPMSLIYYIKEFAQKGIKQAAKEEESKTDEEKFDDCVKKHRTLGKILLGAELQQLIHLNSGGAFKVSKANDDDLSVYNVDPCFTNLQHRYNKLSVKHMVEDQKLALERGRSKGDDSSDEPIEFDINTSRRTSDDGGPPAFIPVVPELVDDAMTTHVQERKPTVDVMQSSKNEREKLAKLLHQTRDNRPTIFGTSPVKSEDEQKSPGIHLTGGHQEPPSGYI